MSFVEFGGPRAGMFEEIPKADEFQMAQPPLFCDLADTFAIIPYILVGDA
jgi:hypothetical protein